MENNDFDIEKQTFKIIGKMGFVEPSINFTNNVMAAVLQTQIAPAKSNFFFKFWWAILCIPVLVIAGIIGNHFIDFSKFLMPLLNFSNRFAIQFSQSFNFVEHIKISSSMYMSVAAALLLLVINEFVSKVRHS